MPLWQTPYRSLRFDFEHYDKKFYQSHGVVNYTVSEDFTRITEFKYLSGQLDAKDTTIVKEYPMPYQGKDGEIPYYAINNAENDALFLKYKELVNKIPNFYLLGRLAEYKYYNIDAIVDRALTGGRGNLRKKGFENETIDGCDTIAIIRRITWSMQ